MGYTTDFSGAFTVTPQLTPEHRAYLAAFAGTRRMKRDATKAAALPDPVREAVGLPIGKEGAYFVGGEDYRGQSRDDSVLDYNEPPGIASYESGGGFSMSSYNAYAQARRSAIEAGAQPGLWCQWVPTDDGHAIEWDQGEKFYEYIEWIKYLIHHFLKPWGYTLNGEVSWYGEEREDTGLIRIVDNEVRTGRGTLSYPNLQ